MPKVKTPEWVKDAIFYQIFPDRFAKSDKSIKPNNLEPWDTPPTVFGYKGGDLWGVIDHLDHIQGLGVNAIYFTPIFQSPSNHRYHTHDYYLVDPLLGGNEAFRALLDAVHQRGMKLVLDGVFNHASRGNFFFNDILENEAGSAWYDWFIVHDPHEIGASAYDKNREAGYEGWVGLKALPKWNTDNPQVREYLMQIGEYWIREGIDGWRLDVPFCVTSPGFWHEFRQRVKAINPEAYIVGEVWWDSRNYLMGDQFDGVMNYLITESLISFAGQHHIQYPVVKGLDYDPHAISGEHFAYKLGKVLNMYDWEVAQTQLNLLDSHDTPRLITIVNGDKPSVRLATTLLMTLPGAPSIYYGDEIGLPGGKDPDCRRTFPWDHPEQWDQDALAYHKELIALRNNYRALRRGRLHELHYGALTFAFARVLDQEQVMIAVNAGEDEQTIAIEAKSLFKNGQKLEGVFGSVKGQTCGFEKGALTITLPPREVAVLVHSGKK